MSRFAVIPTVWLTALLTSSQKLVLCALASFADGDGYSWPSIPALAERASLSERTVQAALRALQDMGVVQVEERYDAAGDRTSNGYWLTGYDLKRVVQSLHHGGATAAPRVVQPLHPNSTTTNRPNKTATTPPAPALRFEQPAVQEVYKQLRCAAPNAAAVDASLRALAEGMTTGRAVPMARIGEALLDLVANGEAFNVARLRGYLRKQEQAVAGAAVTGGRRGGPNWEAIVEQLKAEGVR